MSRPLNSRIKEGALALSPEGSFLVLLEVRLNQSETLFLADADDDVVFDGQTYRSFDFNFSAGAEENNGNIGQASLAVANATGYIATLMERNLGFTGDDTTVIVRFVFWEGGSTSTSAVYQQTYQVRSSGFNDRSAQFVLGAEDYFRATIPRRFYNKRFCGWQYKSAECGYGRQVLTVVDATNASPIVLRLSRPHGAGTGEEIVVSGVLGNTAANGTHRAAYVDSLRLALHGTTGSGAYSGGGQAVLDRRQRRVVAGATNASPIVLSTTTPHGWLDGYGIVVSGVGGNTAANGSWRVTVVDATSVELDGSTGNGSYTTGGEVLVDRGACDRTLNGPNGCEAHENFVTDSWGIVAATAASPIVLTLDRAWLPLTTGQTVVAYGGDGLTGLNGSHAVDVIGGGSGNQVRLMGSSGSGTYTANSGRLAWRTFQLRVGIFPAIARSL